MKMDLSPTQKANIRKRLKAADDVVMKIQQSGIECNALVSTNMTRRSGFHLFLYCRNQRRPWTAQEDYLSTCLPPTARTANLFTD
jgi:hypothetical protein